MNIAYLISAHTDAPQLKRLIEALQPDAHFFVHIDRKSDIRPFTDIIQGKNIHFLNNRYDVRWGTFIEVEYQMALLHAAVEHPTPFQRIFFLSGMDYPLWSNGKIEQWLQQQGAEEILQGINMDTPHISAEQHELYAIPRPLFRCFNNTWNQRLSILCRKIIKKVGWRRPLSFSVDGQTWHLYKGSAWWCISEELAQYILQVYDTKKEIKKYFANSFGQAETMIQTIAFNSPKWANRCIRTEGAYPGLSALTPLHFIDYVPVIKVLDESDYERLMESGKMFCRKVVSGKSDRLVDLLSLKRKEHE